MCIRDSPKHTRPLLGKGWRGPWSRPRSFPDAGATLGPVRALVVGAGIGGLVAARALRRAGLEVLVLEAHTYPGGLAGTFIHRGYRFDAGATLLSGLAPGGPMALIAEALEVRFPVEPFPEGFPLMAVHLPRGEVVRPVGREAEREAQRDFFGPRVLPFWRWQEERAKALLRLALSLIHI